MGVVEDLTHRSSSLLTRIRSDSRVDTRRHTDVGVAKKRTNMPEQARSPQHHRIETMLVADALDPRGGVLTTNDQLATDWR
jgi:hypothetical protein